jgi:hypothetical protein
MSSGATIALTLIFISLLLASVPAWVAVREGSFFSFDCILLLLPACLCYVVADYANPAVHVGFGMFFYPFAMLLVSVALLYARVFLFDQLRDSPRGNSLLCLVACAVAAVFVGAFALPFGE